MVEPFYGSIGPRNARIMIVGESWGASEAAAKRPFANPKGAGGLLDDLLREAGIDRRECFITNVVCERPAGNDMKQFFLTKKSAETAGIEPLKGLYPKPIIREHLFRLYSEIEMIKPDLIIGFGNYALWALTDDNFKIGNAEGYKIPTGIANWRGSQLRTNAEAGNRLFLPTFHPAAILRQWVWRAPTSRDLLRAVGFGGDAEGNAAWVEPRNDFMYQPDFATAFGCLDDLLFRLDERPVFFSVDLETYLHSHISCVGIGMSAHEAICIPFVTNDREPYWEIEAEAELVILLRNILQHPNARIIGQNFGYDLMYIANDWFCFDIKVHHDTMLAQNLIFPGTPKALYYLASLYAEHYVYWKDEGKELSVKESDVNGWIYNCKDAAYTFEVFQNQTNLIREEGLSEQWEEQLWNFHLAIEMMHRGVKISRKKRSDLSLELLGDIAEREQWFASVIDWYSKPKSKSPWWRSVYQQKEIFYDILGIPPVKHSKTFNPTVDDEALELLKARCPIMRPVFEKLQELRSLSKFHETVQAKLERGDRMSCMYNPGGTETFRWSSGKNPFDRGANLQNISEGTEG